MVNATRRNCLWVLVFLAISVATGWSQDAGDQGSAGPDEPNSTSVISDDALLPDDAAPQEQIAPAYSTAGMGIPLEAPLRNYLLFGVTANESVQYSPVYTLSGPYQTNTITRVFGSVDYLRTKGRSQTSIDYRGGGFFFVNSNYPDSSKEVQELTAQQRFTWRRTRLTLVDSVSNFPGGNFGAGWFGGASAYNLGFPNGTPVPGSANTADFFGFNTFGGLGQANYFTNVALAELSQDLTQRSTLTFAGAYAFSDHIGNTDFISGKQATGTASYGYQLTHRTTLGAFYGYQDFRFPGGDDVMTNTVQATLQHQFSSSTGVTIGGGPQFIRFHGSLAFTIGSIIIPFSLTNTQVGASAYASAYHNIGRSALALSYTHQFTGGSGLFAGASSDIATVSWSRAFSRVWALSVDGGFVRLTSVGTPSTGLLGNSYSYGFIGAGVQRKLGRGFSAYASYQFNDENFDNSSCATTATCNGLVGTHVGSVGISWKSRPVVLGGGDEDNPGAQAPETSPASAAGNQPSLP